MVCIGFKRCLGFRCLGFTHVKSNINMRKTNLGGPFLDVNLFLGLGSPWSSDMCVFGLGFALALGNVLAPPAGRRRWLREGTKGEQDCEEAVKSN